MWVRAPALRPGQPRHRRPARRRWATAQAPRPAPGRTRPARRAEPPRREPPEWEPGRVVPAARRRPAATTMAPAVPRVPRSSGCPRPVRPPDPMTARRSEAPRRAPEHPSRSTVRQTRRAAEVPRKARRAGSRTALTASRTEAPACPMRVPRARRPVRARPQASEAVRQAGPRAAPTASTLHPRRGPAPRALPTKAHQARGRRGSMAQAEAARPTWGPERRAEARRAVRQARAPARPSSERRRGRAASRGANPTSGRGRPGHRPEPPPGRPRRETPRAVREASPASPIHPGPAWRRAGPSSARAARRRWELSGSACASRSPEAPMSRPRLRSGWPARPGGPGARTSSCGGGGPSSRGLRRSGRPPPAGCTRIQLASGGEPPFRLERY